jgi:glycosyltransferase involved in cell wall biosynthesis
VTAATGAGSVICFSTADWNAPLWTNKQHLMSRLAANGVPVLYLDSLGLRAPGLGRADLSRMAGRLSAWRPYATPAAEHLHRDSPLVIPLHRFAPVRAVNRRLLAARLARNERRLGFRTATVWAYAPPAVDAFRPGRHRGLVYHCVDDVAAFPGIDEASFRAGERRLARAADVCLASSRPLVRHLEELGARQVRYWPNPADTAAYRLAAETPVERRDARPVIGFVGAVQEHKVDVELVVAVARARPGWRVVLAGPVGLGLRDSTLDAAAMPPNVELPGLVTRDRLPAFVAGLDVGIIPYRQNRYTRGVFPMKVFEYLGAGLPVVSTSLPSLVGEVEHVAFADDAEGFVAAIEAALADPAGAADRRDYAAGFSWERRTEEALELLAELGH